MSKEKSTETEAKQVNNEKQEIKFENVKKKPTQLELAKSEAAEMKDMALRKMAELENYRRNNQNLSKDVRERTVAEVIKEFLPAIDAFSRAEGMITDEKTKSGVGIIKEQLLNVLKRYNVTAIEAADAEFNPNLHECIMQVDSPDKAGKVIYEIEKGYMIGDKILRYSKVAVGKQEEAAANADSSENK